WCWPSAPGDLAAGTPSAAVDLPLGDGPTPRSTLRSGYRTA
ncbi:MAG: hypothetical protein AVDCRST_MAG49-1204, partial [uncultured Thermomicrobiales bacterium]